MFFYNFSYTSNKQQKYFSYSVKVEDTLFPFVRIGPDAQVTFRRESSVRTLAPASYKKQLPTCRTVDPDFDVKGSCLVDSSSRKVIT